MRHSSTRNVIERCFGILKARWGILRDNSYYPIDLKNKIIMACCLLHNYIRHEMTIDPFENRFELDEEPEMSAVETMIISLMLVYQPSGLHLETI